MWSTEFYDLRWIKDALITVVGFFSLASAFINSCFIKHTV